MWQGCRISCSVQQQNKRQEDSQNDIKLINQDIKFSHFSATFEEFNTRTTVSNSANLVSAEFNVPCI